MQNATEGKDSPSSLLIGNRRSRQLAGRNIKPVTQLMRSLSVGLTVVTVILLSLLGAFLTLPLLMWTRVMVVLPLSKGNISGLLALLAEVAIITISVIFLKLMHA